jgi:general secretion pathway protein D
LAAEPTPGAATNEASNAPATTIQTSTNQSQPAPIAIPEAAGARGTSGLVPGIATNVIAAANATTGTNTAIATNAPAPTVVVETGTNGLRLNFRGAPLSLVLDYLSDAAGFIINKETDVRGTVEVWSKEPLTKDEAVEVLNSVLKKNGCAVIRNGRILTIVSQDTAKTKETPIVSGNDPDAVERGDEVVTQIIPVKYATVSQLVPNLELLLPTTATLSANESANSLILVATKTDIKRMLKIITALDTSIASVSSIRVIPLKYADAKDTATLISTLFTPQGGTQGANTGGRSGLFSMLAGGGGPFGGGGGPGGFGGRGGTSSGRGGSSGSAGGAGAAKVVAVGDDRSNSLVISAPADLLATIETMVKEIDQEVTDVTELRVFRLVNADSSEIADQLAQLFPDPTSSNSGSQNAMTPFSFFRGGMGGRGGTATTTANNSDRMKKMGRVLAVPDPRTSSLIVMASKLLMPQIADMVTELDSDKGRKEIVGYFDLQNADPQDVYNNLQDLFQRNSVRPTTTSANPMLGQNSPLNKRITSNTQPTTQGATSTISGGASRSGTAAGF